VLGSPRRRDHQRHLSESPAMSFRRSSLDTCIPMCRPCWHDVFGLVVRSWPPLGVIDGDKNSG